MARSDDLHAEYFVTFTIGASRRTHPANFDFLIADGPNDAVGISTILFENDEGGESVMVLDASSRTLMTGLLPGYALMDRNSVIGTPLAKVLFALYDDVFLGDPRIKVGLSQA